MNLEDLAKKTIDEVHHQIKEQERQLQSLKEQEEEHQKADEAKIETLEDDHLKTSQEDILEQIQMAKFQEEQENLEINDEDETKGEPLKEELVEESEILNPNIIAKVQSLNEDIFLKNLKERILVLFEGLNDTKKEDLDARLELTINFLEFLLANIEDRLNK
ncbi:effector protein CiaD [Campylobacter upsaliensis]|uniref:2-oxoglutarate:acceptor oxidoreductase n=1 Tax=Campylobacter upsaliensis TaxID=28080 RepID=A0A7U8B2Q0_CAMUP|nr:2-oxoglutarate:acceptor oxidoreductase [Campylobacter upsaliensis]EAB5281625.1 2-oxoglutarate:acceptor oxidoreductase [Campylobacter upsaliensis]EAH5546245.1 2-oxoglutarate:acceptor oxidoreductase [Campylobacter upsaliensis]EAH5553088.1 2-oxoglutarate:acceptor oxidoreductase [Campylobacter upsaliensis]EAH5676408.1 2-oxoglutarate:acceptor oxidoreductase [Campylobacter upsaliensis]EAH5848147.1 2-oxoglutarate:acceptor oxidoreductase [Campylobacter upsaliensis]